MTPRTAPAATMRLRMSSSPPFSDQAARGGMSTVAIPPSLKRLQASCSQAKFALASGGCPKGQACALVDSNR